jgi:hypothetical protein
VPGEGPCVAALAQPGPGDLDYAARVATDGAYAGVCDGPNATRGVNDADPKAERGLSCNRGT